MAAQSWHVPLQNSYRKPGKSASWLCCELMNDKMMKTQCMSAPRLLSVYSVFTARRANSLPAGAFCGASSHATRLELGLLWRVCLLPRLVPPCLDRVPPPGTECHFNLQTDLAHHPSRLPGTRGVPLAFHKVC